MRDKNWVLGLAGLLAWLLLRKKPEVPPTGTSAKVSIAVYDPEGSLVLANSPVTLQFGVLYIIRTTVANTSTQGGLPVGVNLIAVMQLSVNIPGAGYVQIGGINETVAFGPDQALAFDFAYTPGSYGEVVGVVGNGLIEAFAISSVVGQLASAQEFITYSSPPPPPIQYGASVILGIR